jgi:probable HAF family extracellular repeat protein
MTDIDTLDNGTSEALAINGAGTIVGDFTVAREGLAFPRAFVFSGGQMKELNQLVAPDSGWDLRVAAAVNEAGQIAGLGTLQGQEHAFLLNPKSPAPTKQGDPPALGETTTR